MSVLGSGHYVVSLSIKVGEGWLCSSPTYKVFEPSFVLMTIEAKHVRKLLVPGRTVAWEVNAYDEEGRLIASTAHDFSLKFIVAVGFRGNP
jgi:hypothetical protein